jgi:DNA-directed RNA polymerase specialized sigma24 family protein
VRGDRTDPQDVPGAPLGLIDAWNGADGTGAEPDAGEAVAALYRSHALGLTRLAFLMLGDRHSAEDVVQEAFCGLYWAWDRLPEHSNVLAYLRVSVLNGCRSAVRPPGVSPARCRCRPPHRRKAMCSRAKSSGQR